MKEENERGQQPEYIKEALEHLVALIINQDHVAQGWLKFLITLQAALVAAISYLFAFAKQQSFIMITEMLIPIIGIATCIPLTLIVLRERKWQCWYVKRVNALPANIPPIFPKKYGCEGGVDRQHLDYISKIMLWFSSAIIIFWIALLVVRMLY